VAYDRYGRDLVECVFVDPEGRKLHSHMVDVTGKWSPEQIESIARLQTRDYAARCVIRSRGYQGTQEETKMSYDQQNEGFARWCSTGQHAFDPLDKGRKKASITEYDDDGMPHDVTKLMCGDCAAKSGFMQPKPKELKAPALQAKADAQLYAEFLEWKNGMRDSEPEL